MGLPGVKGMRGEEGLPGIPGERGAPVSADFLASVSPLFLPPRCLRELFTGRELWLTFSVPCLRCSHSKNDQ